MELLEQDPEHCCDDGTMPADSYLAKNHKLMVDSGNNANRPLTMIYDMQRMVEETGFVNVHKTDYKFPIGEWPKLQVYKDAGRVALNQIKNGIEGWWVVPLSDHGRGANVELGSFGFLLSTELLSHGVWKRSRSICLTSGSK